MRTLIVCESMYGNTRRIAEEIAEGLGAAADAVLVAAHEAPSDLQDIELLVVGGPTHMHGLATAMSRRMASAAAQEDGAALEPDATAEHGLRTWLRDAPRGGEVRAATFDTRGAQSATLTGSAARGIARRLRHHGYHVVESESFIVEDSEGPPAAGELERARAWGAKLRAWIGSDRIAERSM